MPEKEIVAVTVGFPKNVYDALIWYCNQMEKDFKRHIVYTVESDLDSELCSNCEKIGTKYAEELRILLGR